MSSMPIEKCDGCGCDLEPSQIGLCGDCQEGVEPTNEDRRQRARNTIDAYRLELDGGPPDESNLRDLLADLMHLAAYDTDTVQPFDKALESARSNYRHETGITTARGIVKPTTPGEEIAPSLNLHKGSAGHPDDGWCLFDGEFYRGYTHGHWSNRAGDPRWIVEAWNRDHSRTFSRKTYKSESGAKAALIRSGRALAG